jgi:hypothetical protein
VKAVGRLNAICPYFTMFPLEFPLGVLRDARPGQWVMDPFCGRGTTNYAARTLGLSSIGVDSSPVAVAITEAKLVDATPLSIVAAALRILDEVAEPSEVPEGEFWEWAFHGNVLTTLCRLKEGLLKNCRSDARKALRAILIGALHGPRPKSRPSYFSNQSPRTYAPKPHYAVGYWKKRRLLPEAVDVLEIVIERAQRYYPDASNGGVGRVIRGDSRHEDVCAFAAGHEKVNWVITSPPYYGIRTYIPDQWLRYWFLGGPAEVEYSRDGQVLHSSPEVFASQLKLVWKNVGAVCAQRAQLVVRFGGINDRKADPLSIIELSLADSGFKVRTIKPAGSASSGNRQALHFSRPVGEPRAEYDVWATWCG